MKKETLKKIGTWLVRGDTGQSSLSLCAVYLGTDEKSLNYPYDWGDFNRCVGFLNLLTREEEKFVLRKAALQNENWKKIYSEWADLMILYQEKNGLGLGEKLNVINFNPSIKI